MISLTLFRGEASRKEVPPKELSRKEYRKLASEDPHRRRSPDKM